MGIGAGQAVVVSYQYSLHLGSTTEEHVRVCVADHEALAQLEVGKVVFGLYRHADIWFPSKGVVADQIGAVIDAVDGADEGGHVLMNGREIVLGHKVFADALLIGDDKDMLKILATDGKCFWYAWEHDELVWRSDVVIRTQLVDDTVAVEEQGWGIHSRGNSFCARR